MEMPFLKKLCLLKTFFFLILRDERVKATSQAVGVEIRP